jgi:NhaP-type Na+/H+ or K+/H+ antiporter
MEGTHGAFTLALAMAAGMLAQSAARHLRLPSIVLLLTAGAGLGPDGLGWVQPRSLGEGLLVIVDLAVAVILFEGGLNLEISRLRREQAAIRRLVTWGALITLVGGALAASACFDWPWTHALLFGSLVVVTGPTVIGPLMHELRLRTRVATVLEAEGVLIDPIGAILAVLMLEIAIPAGELSSEATDLLVRLGFGAVAGVGAGFAIAGLLWVRRLLPEGHENIFVLASVLLLFQGCEAIISHSGLLAVTLAGVVVGNLRLRVDRDLREFKDQLTVLLIGLLFVLLAADVRLEDVRALGWRGVAVVGVLVFAVRPINVWLSTLGSDLTRRERWFVAWVAPRGIVAAAVASVTAGALEQAQIVGGNELRALVFLAIGGTVLLAGLTALPVAALLGLRLPGRDTVALLGAQGLGFALGAELRANGRPVVFLDSNPLNCRRAEEAGFAVVYGDALQERTMLRVRPEAVGVVVGITPNQMLNSIFVSRSRERFGVPRGYVAAERPQKGLALELVESEQALLLFEGPHDVERWDVRARQGDVEIEHWSYRGEKTEREETDEGPAIGESFVILAARRGKQIAPMHSGFALKQGDVVSVALYAEERQRAHDVLRELGFEEYREAEAA